MEIMKKRNIFFAALTVAAGLSAQELNESLRVEGEYIPEVIRQDKIYTFPKVMSTEGENVDLPFTPEGVVSNYTPGILPMPAVGWENRRSVLSKRGYLTFDAGSYLDIAGNAGYRFINEENSSAGVMLRHLSTNLFKAHPTGVLSDRRRYRYDETLGLYGKHLFDGAGTLSGEVWYHFGYFNYYGLAVDEGYIPTPHRFPTQALNDVGLKFSWDSDTKSRLSYNVDAFYRYFGYRDNPSDFHAPLTGRRENHFRLTGGVGYSFTDFSTLGADLSADYLGYNNPSELQKTDSYGLLTLTPHWQLHRGSLNIRLGANLDFSFNAGSESDRYSAFHISPDVKIDWRKQIVGLYLNAGGGTRLHTLASNYELDYYQMPDINNTLPIYSPLDLKAGVVIGPSKGITAEIHLAYRIADNIPCGGWYMAAISPGFTIPGIPAGYTFNPLSGGRYDLKGFSVGARLKVEAGKYVELEGSGSYQPQNGTEGYFNGYDRPRWLVDAGITAKPIQNLRLTLSYEYRGVRTIYTSLSPDITAAIHEPESILCGLRLPDVTNLNFGAVWRITDAFSVRIQARNLLCRKVQILPNQKEEGLRLMAGFGLLF